MATDIPSDEKYDAPPVTTEYAEPKPQPTMDMTTPVAATSQPGDLRPWSSGIFDCDAAGCLMSCCW